MNEETFILQGKDAEAVGRATDTGFLVQEGAVARKEIVPSAVDQVTPIRNRLLSQGVLVDQGKSLLLTKDYTFESPSGAAAAILGRTANGWKEWKLPDGRTLSEVKRVVRSIGSILDEQKRKAIIDRHRELLTEGRIYTNQQLASYYDVFRRKFGPEALSRLDGEALLTAMHDHGDRDSLCYWLEFKSDEEFQTKRFGSIAGGSALKFRVFRRKETGSWQAGGEGNRPTDISLDDAIAYAKTHREQLLKGVELLENLRDDASDEEYAELQDMLDEAAPDVSRLAWGHKYFSLLFPDKLDDIHAPGLQRFHLRKLLQLPPGGDGRYICAGRFIAAARETSLALSALCATLNHVHGAWHHYWRIGTTAGESGTTHWPMMKQRGCIAIGWPSLGDLSWVTTKRAERDRLRKLLHEKDPSSPQAEGRAASEIAQFIDQINEGDLVLAADGATILGVGRVASEYRYEPGFDFPHQRSVQWLSLQEWEMPVREGLRSTVRLIRRHDENIVEAERWIQSRAALPVRDTEHDPSVKPNLRLAGIAGRIQSVLERKSQVILYGPPGTGKTYWAQRAANDLAAISAFGRRFDNLDESEKEEIEGKGGSNGLVRMCCFHPAYGYEDFMEGYRPATVEGKVVFDLRDGVFKRLCRDAEAASSRSFYLIVDEINRGDIPRIFGELLTTLEKDKRGRGILLPVSQEVFLIPRNVYVIGTMNTADRSISLLDAALRRRFGFVEMMPDGTVLRDSTVAGIPLRAWFEALNQRIRDHVGRDSRNLQIGHSYLMQAGSPVKDMAGLKRALRDDIIPLLEEYCYEDYGTLASILGTEVVDVSAQRIRHELFDLGEEDALVQGLLAPFSDISTSSEAISSEESEIEADSDENEDSDDQ